MPVPSQIEAVPFGSRWTYDALSAHEIGDVVNKAAELNAPQGLWFEGAPGRQEASAFGPGIADFVDPAGQQTEFC